MGRGHTNTEVSCCGNFGNWKYCCHHCPIWPSSLSQISATIWWKKFKLGIDVPYMVLFCNMWRDLCGALNLNPMTLTVDPSCKDGYFSVTITWKKLLLDRHLHYGIMSRFKQHLSLEYINHKLECENFIKKYLKVCPCKVFVTERWRKVPTWWRNSFEVLNLVEQHFCQTQVWSGLCDLHCKMACDFTSLLLRWILMTVHSVHYKDGLF